MKREPQKIKVQPLLARTWGRRRVCGQQNSDRKPKQSDVLGLVQVRGACRRWTETQKSLTWVLARTNHGLCLVGGHGETSKWFEKLGKTGPGQKLEKNVVQWAGGA